MAVIQGVIFPSGVSSPPAVGYSLPVPPATTASGTWREYTVDFSPLDVSKAYVLATSFATRLVEQSFAPVPVSFFHLGSPKVIKFMVGSPEHGLSFRVETSAVSNQRASVKKKKPPKVKAKKR